MAKLMIFGLGYSAGSYLAAQGAHAGTVDVTRRAADGGKHLVFDGTSANSAVREALARADDLLVSIPPHGDIDPVLTHFAADLAARPRNIVYLSTIGVYGNHDGAWIDESTELRPANARSKARVKAEQAWLDLAQHGSQVSVLRLSGIYGPGRNALENLKAGKARRIILPGQVFNRIHVEDIAQAIAAAFAAPHGLGIVNVTDHEPAPPQDVIAFAANLAGLPTPPLQDFATAALSEMARSFYGENKRVRNRRLCETFGVKLRYPTFREGLRALAATLSQG